MVTKIIRAKGGAAERQEDINSITIPDLWHIAQELHHTGRQHAAEEILNYWYLAHDMKRALQKGDNLI